MMKILLGLFVLLLIPTSAAFAQTDLIEIIPSNDIVFDIVEINEFIDQPSYSPAMIHSWLDENDEPVNDYYWQYVNLEKPDAPFPIPNEAQLTSGDNMFYYLSDDDTTISISNKDPNAEHFSFNRNSCTVNLQDSLGETIVDENWIVYSAEWLSDAWIPMPVNGETCTSQIFNDSSGVYINTIKENDLGIFAVSYIYTQGGLESTISYHNNDESTQGTIDENDNILTGTPYKFGFTQTVNDLDVTGVEGFASYTELEDILETDSYYYTFKDSKEKLWGIYEGENFTYFDFKFAKEPTDFESVLSIDPVWSSQWTQPSSIDYPRTFDFDSNNDLWTNDYTGTSSKIYELDSTTGNVISSFNSIRHMKGGVEVQGSYVYGSAYSDNGIKRWSQSGGSYSNTQTQYRPYGFDFDSIGNVCWLDYTGSHGECSGAGYRPAYNVGPYPHALAVNHASNNDVWITDSNGVLWKFPINSGSGTQIATGITSGVSLIDMDSTGLVYFLNKGTGEVDIYSAGGTYQTSFGSIGTGTGQWASPDFLKVDKNDDIWIADYIAPYNTIFYKFSNPPPAAPTAPQTLTTSQSVANEIILNYLAPSSSGTAPITNYKIYLGGTLIDTIGNVLTYTDTISGSEIGSGLTYSVKAVNSVGDSPASNNSFITAWDVPDAPVSFQAVTGFPITMSYVTPLSDDVITGYKIYRDSVLIDTLGVVNSYTDNTTVSGNSYVYSATALSAVGESSQSNTSTATAGIAPDAPTISLAINDVNATPLDIEISISHGTSMGSGTFSNFVVQRSSDNINWTTLSATPTSSPHTDTVPNSGSWYYRVSSQSSHGTSVPSAVDTITTPNIPDAPATISTTISNPNSNPLDIAISFTASPDDQGSAITGYNIYKSSDDVTYTLLTTLGNSVFSYVDTVSAAGQYYYKVSSLNNVGEGLQSSYSTITTPNVPDAPVLSSAAVSSTQIDSTWTIPNDNNSNIVSYDISVDGTVTNVGNTNSNSQNGLTQNTSYSIKVRAINNVGASIWSNVITVTTNTPPTGTNTITLNNSWGDVVIVDNVLTVAGNPTPTLDKIEFVLDGAIVSTINNPSLTGTYAITLPDAIQHGLLIAATASNGDTTTYNSNSLLVTGATVSRVGAAEGSGTIAYTIARTPHPTDSAADEIELKWAKDTFPFNGSCTFMTPSTAGQIRDLNNLPSGLVYTTQNNVNIYDATVNVAKGNNIYVYCWSDNDLQFAAQSEALGSNALLSGLSGLDAALGTTTVDPVTGAETSYSILGAPMIVIFVLLIAGQATGRTAPTFIIILLAAVGILMGLGFFIIDEGIFGLMLIMGALGVMIGKKFL